MAQTTNVVIKEEKLRGWCIQVLKKGCGVSDEYAFTVTDALVSANLRGIDSHGVNLIHFYVRRYRNTEHTDIRITGDMPAFCHIDGGGQMGPVVSVFAMNKAIEKAAVLGVGMVLVENSSHFGAAGYYSCLAAKKGFIGFSTTSAYRGMTPWGGLECFIGNNPISVTFPWREFPIMLDMSTSVIARNKVINYAREGWPLAEDWATDEEGNSTTDAKKALNGFLQPVGKHKGVGIAVMIDLILGAITHSHQYSRGIVPNLNPEGKQNVPHFFMAIKPDCFISKEEIETVMEKYVADFHQVKRMKDIDRLYLPGEIEFIREQERREKGIPLTNALVKELNEFSAECGAEPLLV